MAFKLNPITGKLDLVNAAANPASPAGAIQVNIGSVFSSVDGMVVDYTGNTRGTAALDIQSLRGSVTQVASGINAVSVGVTNTASGNYSTALGNSNTASNTYTSAVGRANNAAGASSSAIGYKNSANGINSSASGYFNIADGDDSSAFGHNNYTASSSSAFGFNNTILSGNAVALGYSNNLISGNTSSAVGTSNTINATRSVALGHQNTINTGSSYSAAMGVLNTSGGGGKASAMGYGNTAGGTLSTASGYYNRATGSSSAAFGYNNVAGGNGGIAIGYSTSASGSPSVAVGLSVSSSASYASAFGTSISNTTASSTEIGPSNGSKLGILSTGHVTLLAGAIDIDPTDGSMGDVLTTDGSGNWTMQPGGGGGGFWSQSSGTLYPTTSTDRVLVGGAIDDTTSPLQVLQTTVDTNMGVFYTGAGNTALLTPLILQSMDNSGYHEIILQTCAALRIGSTLVDGNNPIGVTNQFRMLPYAGDIYFQNTNSSGAIYFSGYNAAPIALTAFTSTLTTYSGDMTVSGELFVLGKQKWGQSTSKFLILPDWTGIGELDDGTLFGTVDPGSGDVNFFADISDGLGGLDVGAKVNMGYWNGSSLYSAMQVANVASGFSNILLMKSGGNVGINTGATSPSEAFSIGEPGTTLGVISLAGDTSGKVIIQPATAAGTWTLTLPTTDGNANEFLQTNGSGVTTWAAAPFSVTTGDLTTQTATASSVVTVTSPNDGVAHQYAVGAYIDITAISAGTVTITYTFTDENNVGRTLTLFPMGLTSASISVTGFIAFPTSTIRVKANTAMTMVATFTGVSVSYDVGGNIQRIN